MNVLYLPTSSLVPFWFLTFLTFSTFFSLSTYTVANELYGAGPNNAQLRQDLVLLSQNNRINLPTTVWPIPWRMISNELQSIKHKNLSPGEQLAFKRIQALQPEQYSASVKLQASSQPALLTQYGFSEIEDESLALSLGTNQQHWSSAITITQTASPLDNKSTRPDDSYLTGHLDNWNIGVGALDRWWGPGWQSSLILSNNARPVPSVFLSRTSNQPFNTSWLNWLGNWHAITFLGELESERTIPNARLWGARVTLQPTHHWEIGLSRTAMWAGDGRPSGFDTFWDLLLGQDNYDDPTLKATKEPGNQLGGFDFLYKRNIKESQLRLYAQWIGEDEAGYLPSRSMALFGSSLTQFWQQAFPTTVYLEIQDTVADVLKPERLYNTVYQHGIYRTGYRTYGRVMGASTDNDTRTATWGLFAQLDQKQSVQASFSYHLFNRDGLPGGNTVAQSPLEAMSSFAQYRIRNKNHLLTFFGQVFDKLPENLLQVDDKLIAGLSYQYVIAPNL